MDFNVEAISAIQGIGPAHQGQLEQAGLTTVFDLLRQTADEIHLALKKKVSKSRLEQWISAAELLQVEGMNPQWAEALVASGIGGLDDLCLADGSTVSKAFETALSSGTIPDAPTPVQQLELLRDATVLRYTATCDGTVVGPLRKPIADVTVHLGSNSVQTNAQGRFRFLRLPATDRPPLRIEHPRFDLLLVEDPPTTAAPHEIHRRVYLLRPLAEGEKPMAIVLREVDGDELPEARGHAFRAASTPLEEISDGEILEVHEVAESTSTVKLVSRFLVYRNGDFVVRHVRVPGAQLPEGLEVGDRVEKRPSGLVKVQVSNLQIRRRVLSRICKRHFSGRPQVRTPEGLRADFQARWSFLAARGFHRSPLRRTT